MRKTNGNRQCLIALPPRAGQGEISSQGNSETPWRIVVQSASPEEGTARQVAQVLLNTWQQQASQTPFMQWLVDGTKVILLGDDGGRSLPAYSATGAPLMPIPVFRWARGQRLDQRLLDLQLPVFERLVERAEGDFPVLIARGNALLRLPEKLPALSAADVLALGLWATPERAKDFGVFFCSRQQARQLAFFIDRPRPETTRERLTDHLCLADTGLWFLSAKAVRVLLGECGAALDSGQLDSARRYDLYADFAAALGSRPAVANPVVRELNCEVVALANATLHTFAASRQLIASVSELQNIELDEAKLGLMGAKRHPDQYLQNAKFSYPLRLEQNHTLWVENSVVSSLWELAHDHILTGIPENDWPLRLEPGVCLDFVPVDGRNFCVRCYGIDDAFEPPIDSPEARWFGRPFLAWFRQRGLRLEDLQILPSANQFDAPIFPVLAPETIEAELLEWLFREAPGDKPALAQKYAAAPRLSARQLREQIDLGRLEVQRDSLRQSCLLPMLRNYRYSVFFKLDLESTARIFARGESQLPDVDFPAADGLEPLQQVHDQMFRSAVRRHRQEAGWETNEANAFGLLREMIVRDAQLSPARPRRCVLDDQIVWARSPVRLDLAGGWTDTPPYCLEYGGKVLNLAVDLNGQPPIQVFAKLCARPELVLRSIDLGTETRVTSYAELDTFAEPGSAFALAKAAVALAGFLPRFHADGGFSSLEKQLEDFGGGLELSLLSAVPKGSGLGTSSILAATVLATLGDLCGLNWDREVLFTRTLALEQMLTTGGGWQDQAGAIFRGIKLIETSPGLRQKPTLRWLPSHLFDHEHANKTILLYYTGITRLAKNILQEIVRGIFLNSPEHLRLVEAIGANADGAFNALQECNFPALTKAIDNSWRLNQALDTGTNPAPIQAILDQVDDYLLAAKLLGAGGGGYLLFFAKDDAAAAKLQRRLQQNPPNPRARFVQFTLSETGLHITRS